MIEWLVNWFAVAVAKETMSTFLMGMALPIFSVGGVCLSTSINPRIRRVGFYCGIVSQPFWFYAAFAAYNIGMVINAIFFTLLWVGRVWQLMCAPKLLTT